MRKLMTTLLVAAALCAGALMVPSAAQAQCRGCEIDMSGCYRCLLGCSIDGSWCSNSCFASCDYCSLGSACYYSAVGADGTVLALNEQGEEGQPVADELQFVRFVSGDGETVYRRPCDAAVMSRRYSADAVQRGRDETRLIRI